MPNLPTETVNDKGAESGECNRTACKNRPAVAFNKGTQQFYCVPCAEAINAYAGETVCVLSGRVL